jgi:hypothetical protein
MHNPHDPLGSIRADKVGAFRVFGVLLVVIVRYRRRACRQTERCPARATLLSPIYIEFMSGSGSF